MTSLTPAPSALVTASASLDRLLGDVHIPAFFNPIVPPSVKKQCEKISRQDRQEVRIRASGQCETCGLKCRMIGNIHHVTPASHGGWGVPSNLIFLCPNCHATIHLIRKQYLLSKHQIAWIRETFTVGGAIRLIAIAREIAVLENDQWIVPERIFDGTES